MTSSMLRHIVKRGYASSSGLNDVVIVGAARTPMGGFRGYVHFFRSDHARESILKGFFSSYFRSLSSLPAPRLGALAIEEALKRANCPKDAVQELYMGSVLQASMGQAPDRQAALFAGKYIYL